MSLSLSRARSFVVIAAENNNRRRLLNDRREKNKFATKWFSSFLIETLILFFSLTNSTLVTMIWNIIFTISNWTRIEFEKNLIFDTLKFEEIYWVNNSMLCVWIRNSRKFRNDVVFERIEKKRNWFCLFSWSRIDRKTTLLCFQRFSRCQNNRFTITEMRIWIINVCNCWKWIKIANIRFANCKNIERYHIYWQVVNDRTKRNEIWITMIVKICFLICVLSIYLCDIDENRVFIEIHWFDKFTSHKMTEFTTYKWFRVSFD